MADGLEDTAAVRFGNHPRLIQSAVRSSSALETTTPLPQMWKLARKQLLRRTARLLTISLTLLWRWT
jgi:hypothetical protein